MDSVRPIIPEVYQGHILQVMVATLPTDKISHMIRQTLMSCYPPGLPVPPPDTLHYTLGEHPSHLAWTHDRLTSFDAYFNTIRKREIFLSHDDHLGHIISETATIYAFLPPPNLEAAMPPLGDDDTNEVPQADQAEGFHPGNQEPGLPQEETTPTHQIFVQIPDTWTLESRRPAYTQTMPVPTTLENLKTGLSALLSIPSHLLNILYGGKLLHSRLSLAHQGVVRGVTVYLKIGSLLGGADTDMSDSPLLAGSTRTPQLPPFTHSSDTQTSIEEWIDRLRMSSPLTQDLATINMLMTALNLTKEQATTAIMQALNEKDEDTKTDASRFEEVSGAFPENFQDFLAGTDTSHPTDPTAWTGIADSFKLFQGKVTRHVERVLNPARKHRLAFKTNGQLQDPPSGTLKHSETFTLSNLNIFSVTPLIKALSDLGFQPGTSGFWQRDITFRPPDQLDPRMGTGSATISILRTTASVKTLYDLYVTRTISLQIQGQDSQPTWHLYRADSRAEIEEDSIVLEPSSIDAKREFQFAIAMFRAAGISESDFLDNIMFQLTAAGLWHVAELHTLAKGTCMANLLTTKGQGRSGFIHIESHAEEYTDNKVYSTM